MQHTPTADYPSMKQNIHTFSLRVMEAKELLIQEALIDPMRDDVRDLIVSLKKGILEFMRFFDVQSSEEYNAFIAAKQQVDAFLTDPRVDTFHKAGLECIQHLQHLPDTSAISGQLHELHTSLARAQTLVKYHPEDAYGEEFASLVVGVTNGLARIAGLLPDFAASNVYGTFRTGAFQAGLFIAGLPFVSQSELEADSL